VRIGFLGPADWDSVRAIYLEGIASGVATFETDAPSWEAWNAAHLPHPRLKAVEESSLIGWAALVPVSPRPAYSGVAEVSIYVGQAHRRKGIGKALLTALARSSEEFGIWTLQAGIFAENAGSIALHKACGFREVGTRERIGRLGDIWHDVVLMERRSPRVHPLPDPSRR
jgi:L-amino acid N-acyltransferase YncA